MVLLFFKTEKEIMSNNESSAPRFEFRTFGQHFESAIQKMKQLSEPVPEKFRERRTDEIYLISEMSSIHNVKIRDEKLDIKTLIHTYRGLEQWEPVTKVEFPLHVKFVAEALFPAFEVAIPDLDRDDYDVESLLRIVRIHPELLVVHVNKQRFGFMVNKTICEVANVLINGAMVVTLSSESTEPEDVLKTIRDLGLEELENINYLQAIKRVTGLIDKPLMNLE